MAGRKAMGGNAGQGQAIAGMVLAGADDGETVLPSASSVIQAGAFGAAFSGVTTGIVDSLRVRDGDMTRQEAVHDVAKSSLQGAATMAMASTVAHVARTRPLLGVAVLALAGIGFLASRRETAKPASSPATSAPSPATPATAE